MPESIPGHLFVWRGKHRLFSWGKWQDPADHVSTRDELDATSPYFRMTKSCPFCGATYVRAGEGYSHQGKQQEFNFTCRVCGFRYATLECLSVGDDMNLREMDVSTLKVLDVNDADLAFDELGTHLKRRFDDVFQIDPLRFEGLVADVYKNHGYGTRLTQKSHDGGIDIVLVERSSHQQAIVQCKHVSRPTKRIPVSMVREVLGVQMAEGQRTAKFVTNGKFTNSAIQTAESPNVHDLGFTLELIDADELLKALDVYNTCLPPLSLDERLACLRSPPKHI